MVKILIVVLFCGMIVMNYLANALPLNGMTTGQLSDSYPNLFVPAGLTFSIWGLIYILLAVFCVVQFTSTDQATISKVTWPFAITCILNGLWIVFWHYQKMPLSLITMVGFLITLVYINSVIRNIQPGLIKATFGIYLGWICIATIANVTTLLIYYKWDGAGISEQTWAVIMIFAGTVIASLAIYSFRNPFIALSVLWAFIGILIKRKDDFRSIVIACIVGMIIVTAVALVQFMAVNRSKNGTITTIKI